MKKVTVITEDEDGTINTFTGVEIAFCMTEFDDPKNGKGEVEIFFNTGIYGKFTADMISQMYSQITQMMGKALVRGGEKIDKTRAN